ncbi:hypothetical protein EKO04_005060 [Ascochyta lentis]|uniref:Patatin n=1 Tax=Ascochyta lentis TaxID=205686 RepID=A0A8H7MJF3_9PLEO|nr:hypothetical protein EKO04_005060 [Ascochyta lentis]
MLQQSRGLSCGPPDEGSRTQQGTSYSTSSRVDSFPSIPDDELCDGCDKKDPGLAYCNVCNVNLCPACWPVQTPHRKQRLAAGKVKHEKTDLALARKIRNVLLPTNDIQALTQLHEDDAQTAWFGIERPRDGDVPIFEDYGRYDYLLSATVEAWRAKNAQIGRDGRTPSLVSFVGQSGAGKSSLIKLLIDLRLTGQASWPTPVVGGTGVIDPTSEDVHLYADPVTAISEAPIFFADCEGLSGGEREPMSAKLKRQLKKNGSGSNRLPMPISERELGWADTNSLRSREFAVTNLYPRLLYTFSDVIVFVLKNPRVVESVLEQLVTWAAAALEMSSNQPVLPHVIIVLNASENDIDESQWDSDTATLSVLESLSRTVFKNATFKKYAQFWRERQRQIENVEQLILSYYSSIRVVRIPTHGRPPLIQAQIGSLYTGITEACEIARDRKAELRMLLDAEELQSYLQCAFDHFATSLDRPFDFVQASFSNSPIPLDFGGNILKLAIKLMHIWFDKRDTRHIFQELSYMVASCIMLDCARQKKRGTARDIFPLYLAHLDAALENFCEGHWPCEYVQSTSELRCVNVKSGHGSKGHQTANGKIIAVGEYISTWSYETLHEEFIGNSYYRLDELLELLKKKKAHGDDEMSVAADIDRDDVMTWFYRHVSVEGKWQGYNSHSVCFCCLSEPPEHSLPCGHVLCTPCAKTYGRQHSKTEVDIQKCPLDVRPARVYQPWRIHFKPKSAGVRVLTLDGGGIRGIVELEILRSLEEALGNGLRIQNFFDLVVGTSTGGLVALGLVSRNWSVSTCINNFTALCKKAFTRRFGGNMPFVGWLVDNINHSKYETTPLQEALQEAFSDDQYLFGGQRLDQNWSSPVKVAVTATSSSSSPVVLANYNRRCEGKLSYQFQRPEGIENELKIWEAARATPAAPRYFRPFVHEESKQIYMDGALYHNNPVRVADAEWKLIWSGGPTTHPDIMLSLGTGLAPDQGEKSLKSPISKRGLIRNGRMLLKIATDHIEDALDCEKTWHEYTRPLIINGPSSRFVRYNVDVDGNLPGLDDVKALEPLQAKVVEKLSQDAVRITRLAFQLMATCFYFDVERIQQSAQNTATATGRMCCRFAEGSLEMQELGKLIRDRSYKGKDPFFLVREKGVHGKSELCKITPNIIGDMINSGKFTMRRMRVGLSNKLSEVEIYLYLNDDQQHSISGFPRCLFDDEKDKAKPWQTQAINTRRWAGRSNSRDYQRSLWTPPSRSKISCRETISHYSDPSHVMGHATIETLLSPVFGSTDNLGRLQSTSVVMPGVWELDSEEVGPAQPVHLIRAQKVPIRCVQQSHAGGVFELEGDDPGSCLHTPFPSNTKIEEIAARNHELTQPAPSKTPLLAHGYDKDVTNHIEGYTVSPVGSDVITGEAAQPRSEPPGLATGATERQVDSVDAATHPLPETATVGSTEESLPVDTPASPSPEFEPPQRVPTIPYAIPPFDTFEPVSFSITMNPNTQEGVRALGLEADSQESGQWHWDINF